MAEKSKALQAATSVTYTAHDGQQVMLDLETVKKFLVRGKSEYVTDEELVFYMGICRSRALNPFAMDCYLVKYTPADSAAIIVSRGHYQTRARQQSDCRGWNNGVIIRRQDGSLEYREGHLVLDEEQLVGGWFEAKPDGWDKPKFHTVPLRTYIKRTKEGAITKFWQKDNQPMMIEKIAEVQGLRTIWSKDLANLLIKEELVEPVTRADIPQTSVASESSAPPQEEQTTDGTDAVEEINRRVAAIQDFNNRVAQTGYPEKTVSDFLFMIMEQKGYQNLTELKTDIILKNLMHPFLEDLEKYAREATVEYETQLSSSGSEELTEPPPSSSGEPAIESGTQQHPSVETTPGGLPTASPPSLNSLFSRSPVVSLGEFKDLHREGMHQLLTHSKFCHRLLNSGDDITSEFAMKYKRIFKEHINWDQVRQRAEGMPINGS